MLEDLFEDILDIDALEARRAILSANLDGLRQKLNDFAAEGASLTVAGVSDTRFQFGMTQAELILRTGQIAEWQETRTLEGSLQRAIRTLEAFEARETR
jgi:hypothetical protein